MRKIVLSKGYAASIDDGDFDRVNALVWSVTVNKTRSGTPKFYAISAGDGKRVYMHRFILHTSRQVDHKDGDGLNNQRYNLRRASNAQNSANREKRKGTISTYKGVAQVRCGKRQKRWIAQITKNYKHACIGYFYEEADAALAYNFKAEELFSEFARFNEVQVK